MHRRIPLVLAAVITAAITASCNRTREPERTGDPAPASAGDPGVPKTGPQPTEVAYDAPASWSRAENPNPMRKATFRVPRAAGDPEDGELTVSQAGGSIDQNLRRWAGQLGHRLEEVKREHRSPAGLRVTVVQIAGSYKGMAMPNAPAPETKPGYALLGAIVETAPPTFFKLVGPERTVMAARPDFDKLVASLHGK